MNVKRVDWIDFFRGICILAVVFCHLYSYGNIPDIFSTSTVFSVNIFVLLAGMTMALTIERNHDAIKFESIKKRLLKIGYVYLTATLVYHVVLRGYTFNLPVYLNQVVTFSAAPPFYFFAFYMQFLIIGPFLYLLLKKTNLIVNILILIVLYYLGYYFTMHTYLGLIDGGGRHILGGTFLFSYALGMASYIKRVCNEKRFVLLYLIIGFIGLYAGIVNNRYLISNPPTIHTIIYSIAIYGFLMSFFIIFSSIFSKFPASKLLKKLYQLLLLLGRYSLAIFTYHLIFAHYAEGLKNIIVMPPMVLFLTMYLSGLLLPILASRIIEKLRQVVIQNMKLAV